MTNAALARSARRRTTLATGGGLVGQRFDSVGYGTQGFDVGGGRAADPDA